MKQDRSLKHLAAIAATAFLTACGQQSAADLSPEGAEIYTYLYETTGNQAYAQCAADKISKERSSFLIAAEEERAKYSGPNDSAGAAKLEKEISAYENMLPMYALTHMLICQEQYGGPR